MREGGKSEMDPAENPERRGETASDQRDADAAIRPWRKELRGGGGWRLFVFSGVPVVIRPGILIMTLLVALALGADVFPTKYPACGYGWGVYAAMGAAGAALLFFSILAHEISHCIFARLVRVPVIKISLFFLGGAAELGDEPRTAGSEFAISAAGPAASLVLGGVFFLAFLGFEGAAVPQYISGVARFAAVMNLVLGATNFLPGLPLDGGRVLRALIWMKTGNFLRATGIASVLGRVMGIAGISAGFLSIFVIGFPVQGSLLVVVGLFVERGARELYEQALLRRALEGLKVAEVMRSDLPSIWEGISVYEAVKGYFMRYPSDAFLVVDHLGVPRGVMDWKSVCRVPKKNRRGVTVGRVLPPDILPPVCRPLEDVAGIFAQMRRHQLPAMAVIDKAGEIAGVLLYDGLLRTAGRLKRFVKG